MAPPSAWPQGVGLPSQTFVVESHEKPEGQAAPDVAQAGVQTPCTHCSVPVHCVASEHWLAAE